MNKAFTKESDSDDDLEPELQTPAGVKNYITPSGYAKLKSELESLLRRQRPDLVKTISWAAANGDRSENADYIYGKRKLREIDRRVRFLTKRLESAEVVNPESQAADRVLFGATVTVIDEENRERTYSIVGTDEIDINHGLVSWMSPLAKALLNARVGDVVTLRSPGGEEELEITRINYESLGAK